MKAFIILIFSATVLAGGGTWSEFGDVQSFPDGVPQVTRGSGALTLINGSTSPTSDPRNAYCIKITDPANFYATTNNSIDNAASTDFDTSLFLFDKRGKPILTNDDTGTGGTASTLTSVATDGSGFSLSQAGEYILVVAGFPDKPQDNIANRLFLPGANLVHSANQNAGSFQTWENNNPETGGYFVALQGVSFCQDKLDIVGTEINLNNDSKMCSGDGNGSFANCHTNSIISEKEHITTGYFDSDADLDVIFDVFIRDIPSICLGDGLLGYKSCSVYTGIGTDRTANSVMGDINNDGFTDAVFIASFANHKACLGDGNGFFTSCTDIPNSKIVTDVKLAYMDADSKLDLIYRSTDGIHICPGDGSGGFATCNVTTVNSGKIAIADFNGDNNLDVITSRDGDGNSICLNDGSGGLTCSLVSSDSNRSYALAIGDLENDGDIDVIFANVGGSNPGINRVCQNIGTAIFNCTNISGVANDYSDVKLGLINDDNILDVVFAGRNDSIGYFTRVCIGNGDGTFSNCANDSNLAFSRIALGEFGEKPNTVSVNPNIGTVIEGNDLVLLINLDSALNFDLVLNYEISGDVDANDFNPPSLSFQSIFPAGVTGTGIAIPTVLDNNTEGLENFTVTFSLDTPGIVATGNLVATGVIDDDFIFKNGFD